MDKTVERVFAGEPLQRWMVVARSTVPPVAGVAGKSTSLPMRVPAMRPSATDAGSGGASELLGTAFSGATQVAPRRSDAILEALRPCADGPAGVDGAVATMATIVATSGPPHQVRGKASGGRRGSEVASS